MNSVTTLFSKSNLSEETQKYLKYGLATVMTGLLSYLTYRLIFNRKRGQGLGESSDENSDREEALLVNKANRHKSGRASGSSLLVKT